MQETALILFTILSFFLSAQLHLASSPPSPLTARYTPNSSTFKQTSLECTDFENTTETITSIVLDGGTFEYQLTAKFNACNITDATAIDPKTTVTQDAEVAKGLRDQDTTISNGEISVKFVVQFSGIPGTCTVAISIDIGTARKERYVPFDIVGVAIFQTIVNGEIKFFSGQSDQELPVDETSSNGLITFDSLVYNGDASGPATNNLIITDLKFSLPSDIPIKWTDENCDLRVEDSQKLSENCALGFSLDYKKFYVYMPRRYPSSNPARINITWKGLAEFEAQHSNGGVGVELGDELPAAEFADVLTFLQLPQDTPSSSSSSLIVIITVVGCLVVVGAVVWALCVYKRSRKRKSSGSDKTPKARFPAHFDSWIRGDIPSFRSTAGRTNAVLEDPLSEGHYQMPTVVTGYPTSSKYGAPSDRQFAHQQQNQQGQGHSMLDAERDDSFLPADAVDQIIQERYSADKSVTKLVLPRDITRGVELESSTDGGSDRGDIKSIDDDDDGVGGGSSQQQGGGEGEGTGGGRTTTTQGGETEGTGTVVVGDEQDSRNRTPIGAAIDRVKQLDMLLGPASRGLVGRNGEPILGAAGPSSGEDPPPSRTSRRGDPDSAIMTLSTLS